MREIDVTDLHAAEVDVRFHHGDAARRSTVAALLQAAQGQALRPTPPGEAGDDPSPPASEAGALAAALIWDAESQLSSIAVRERLSRVLEDARVLQPAPLGAESPPTGVPAVRSRRGVRVLVAPGAPPGLAADLAELGFAAQALDEATGDGAGAAPAAGGILLAPLETPEQRARIATLKSADPGVMIVGLIADPTLPAIRLALQEGADGVADRGSPAPEVARALLATLDGHFTLPLELARRLWTEQAAAAPPAPAVSADEAAWLSMLAEGATVPAVARSAGRSERDMFRLLRRLYERLGATSRTEAILKAAEAGLLSNRPGGSGPD